MQWDEDPSNVDLPVTFMRVGLNVNVIVIDTKYSTRHGVVTAHAVPDLNLLATLDEGL
jgi:hypothetical protein